jgi:hypothetical protein
MIFEMGNFSAKTLREKYDYSLMYGKNEKNDATYNGCCLFDDSYEKTFRR